MVKKTNKKNISLRNMAALVCMPLKRYRRSEVIPQKKWLF